MAAREAIKIVADAMRSHLPAELAAMPIVTGDARPSCEEFRDCFTDDSLEPDDWDALVIDLAPNATPAATLGTQGGADSTIPILMRWVTGSVDRADARARVANALHGILRVLSLRVEGTALNQVRLIQLADLSYTFGIEESSGNLEGLIAIQAMMRDERVQS